MKPVNRYIFPLTIVAFSGLAATAHPGHGEPGPAHYIAEPQHGTVWMIALLAGIVIVALGARITMLSKDAQNR